MINKNFALKAGQSYKEFPNWQSFSVIFMKNYSAVTFQPGSFVSPVR
jgi:hypothetical protein